MDESSLASSRADVEYTDGQSVARRRSGTGRRTWVEFHSAEQQQQSDKDVGRRLVRSWSVDTVAGRSEQQATIGGEAAQRRRYDDSVYVLTSCPLMRDNKLFRRLSLLTVINSV